MTGPKEQLDLAKRADATPEELEALAKSPFNFVLTAVATNGNATASVLDALVPEGADSYPDQELLKAVAWNGNTGVATLRRVADRIAGRLNGGRGNRVAFEAGIALFSRFDTPTEVLVALLNCHATSTEFRKVVARQTGRPDVIEVLKRDRSERVRRAIERSEATDQR